MCLQAAKGTEGDHDDHELEAALDVMCTEVGSCSSNWAGSKQFGGWGL